MEKEVAMEAAMGKEAAMEKETAVEKKAAMEAAAMEVAFEAAMEVVFEEATHQLHALADTWENDMRQLGFVKPYPTWWPTMHLHLSGFDLSNHIHGLNDPEI